MTDIRTLMAVVAGAGSPLAKSLEAEDLARNSGAVPKLYEKTIDKSESRAELFARLRNPQATDEKLPSDPAVEPAK